MIQKAQSFSDGSQNALCQKARIYDRHTLGSIISLEHH